MSKRNLANHKPSIDGLESVRIFRDNLAALLTAAQGVDPSRPLMTQAQFATQVGMSLRNLRNLLDGNHAATLRTIERAAKKLHMAPWMLLIEGLPADLALHPENRSHMMNLMRQYILAPPALRRAIGDLLPPSSSNKPTAQ